MAECSECGKESMSFTCKYCGEKFCSEHRLPEKHNCQDLEDGKQEKKEGENNKKNDTGDQRWFEDKDVRDDLKVETGRRSTKSSSDKAWLAKEALKSIKNNATLMIIAVTVVSFVTQSLQPGITPPITGEQLAVITQNPLALNPLTLFPSPEYVLQRPWTIFTVMLLHGGTFHIFANMVTLYFFGRPVENMSGPKEFLKFYLGAGMVASMGFVAFQNLMSVIHSSTVFSPAVGASGAVVACFAAVAMTYPDAEVLLYFFIPMKIRTALYAFGALEVANIIAKLGGVTLPIIGGFASSAHLTGLLIGIWYGRKLREKRSNRAGILDLMGA